MNFNLLRPSCRLATLLAVLFIWPAMLTAQALTATFTYQGELRTASGPADGSFDLRFRLYDTEAGGVQIGPEVSSDGVAIVEGLFSVHLDFGPAQFAGDRQYLEVDVRPSGPGEFETLSPRTELTAAPYAWSAAVALTDSVTSSSIVDSSIGSADIDASQVQLRVTGTCAAGRSMQSVDESGSVDCSPPQWRNNDSDNLYTLQRVGIGIINPAYALHVSGNARVFGNASISSRVGIGTTSPERALHVFGSASVSGDTGLGVATPEWPLHTTRGFVSDRLGVGVDPSNSTYTLRVAGSTLLEGNTRNTGWVAVNEYLRVRENKGIVRSNTSTQYKVIPLTIAGLAVSGMTSGQSITTGVIDFPEAFGSAPRVVVSHLLGGNFTGTGNPYALMAIPRDVTSTGARYEVINIGGGSLSGTGISFSAMAIGPE